MPQQLQQPTAILLLSDIVEVLILSQTRVAAMLVIAANVQYIPTTRHAVRREHTITAAYMGPSPIERPGHGGTLGAVRARGQEQAK